jgi:hypothetical protein
MMSRQITKELAQKIARKLKARSIGAGGAHDIMGVYHGETLIASFGIRRGSEKDKGHDHVQKERGVPTRFAKELGICTKSREQWIELMIAKGEIARDPM